jgi:hypothetical protein
VIDTAVKTGTDNDGTAVTFFGYDEHAPIPLVILDWDIDQIEGAVLESWLPSVFSRLDGLARLCGARMGSIGSVHRGQERRHDPPTAGIAAGNAGAADRLQAHCRR